MCRLSATIHTPLRASHAKAFSLPNSLGCRALALLLSLALALASSADTLTPNPQHKKKKATHPKSPACATGCKPDTSVPALDADAPEDAALQKELAPLARDVRRATPGSYEKLAAFANKNSSSTWGQRAALALAFNDFSILHAQPALNWLQKA